MMDMIPLKSSAQVIASAVTLTATYSAHTVLSVDEQNYLGLLVAYTKGNETSMELKVEVSVDGGTNWFQQTAETASGGSISVDLAERVYDTTGKYVTVINPIKVPQSPTQGANQKGLIRVSTKATGGTPTGTVTITGVVGWV